MRRNEFENNDSKMLIQMMQNIAFGTLLLPDDVPHMLPISFDFQPADHALYFHGAPIGRKFSLLKKCPSALFSAVKNFAYIPSSFLKGKMIPTQFFYSVLMQGDIFIVEDFETKKNVLENLVKKYEKENKNFSMENLPFKNKIKGTFVFGLQIKNTSIKAKFGQNLTPDIFKAIGDDLKNRNRAGDSETLQMMNYFCKKP